MFSDLIIWGTNSSFTDLINYSSHQDSELHEHEVGGWVKVGEVDEWKVVVETVEECRDHVVHQDGPVLVDLWQEVRYWVAGVAKESNLATFKSILVLMHPYSFMNTVEEISSFTASVISTTVVTLYGYVLWPFRDAVTNRPVRVWFIPAADWGGQDCDAFIFRQRLSKLVCKCSLTMNLWAWEHWN